MTNTQNATDASAERPSLAVARIEVDGDVLWAVRRGEEYAPLGMNLAELLHLPAAEARAVVERASGSVLQPSRVLAPVDAQHEVWAAGVTYLRSRDGRIEEATDGTPYDKVYVAERPELFFKSTGVRVVADGEPVGKRADSTWDVPESELGLVLSSTGELFGFVPGNDASSRSIEGENLLYLPQAKVYTAGCALGPEIVPAWAATPPFGIRLSIVRDGATVFDDSTSTEQMARTFDDLVDWLFRGLDFPDGVVLLTGTGLVPPGEFTLADGDEVTISIEGVGRLTNPVVTVGRAG
jgi:2-dehydro-3-deoxy-D-arabinonate dehydratase